MIWDLEQGLSPDDPDLREIERILLATIAALDAEDPPEPDAQAPIVEPA